MKILKNLLQRILIAVVGISVAWFIIFPIFSRLDQRLPLFLAVMLTYFISAYVLLPRVVWVTLLISRKGRIPRFTRGKDGLSVDPVNIILLGTKESLEDSFAKMNWYKADKISIKSSLKMVDTFVRNKPYPKAPFSALFLFGRKQDIGFQEPINNSPRKRHHIRFWATNVNEIIDPLDAKFWNKKQKIKPDKIFAWIGAGSEDVGFGFTKLTYQVSHKVNPDVDTERKYILNSLKKTGSIGKITYYKPGRFKIGKYVSDGKIAVARLKG